MKRILMIVGSMRKESFNKKLALVAKELISDRAEVSFLEYKDIPPMNQDIEYPAPEEIERVRREVKSADGIWFMTAEYNYSYPGVLKNLLDWLSRPLYKGAPRSDTAIYGKKATISGVGGKNATAGARMKLKELLAFMGVDVMVENETGVSLAPDSFGTNTLDLSEEAKERLKKQVESFLSYLK